MKKILVFYIIIGAGILYGQTASITNITASQRTDGSKIVEVFYDLAEDTLFTYFTVELEISLDGGATYQPTNYVSGDAGNGVLAGVGNLIEWNLGAEYGGTFSDQTQVRVTATGRFIEVSFPFELVGSGDFTYGHGDEIRNIPYDYEIMTYETTNADYAEFLIKAYNDGFVSLSGDEVRGFYEGDDNYGPGDYSFLAMWNSRISWNGTTFLVEEGYGNHPVTGVSWYGSWKFADYYALRLPTEEEWEKAARANTGWEYPWGETIDSSFANYYFSGDPYDNGTTPVGFFDGNMNDGFQTSDNSSPYGVYDMAGNIVEWVDSWSINNLDRRVFRGGSWEWGIGECSSSWVGDWRHPDGYGIALGFRCVRTISATRASYLQNKAAGLK